MLRVNTNSPRLRATKRARYQRGITLFESLVAMVVMALGILGILSVQMRTLSDTQTSVRRAQAIRLIEDLSERMKVNPNALNNLPSYTSTFDSLPTLGDCGINGCSPAQQVRYDLAVWKQTVANSLPLGQASIFLAPGETQELNRRQLGVIISWRENEGANTKTDDVDATQVRAADGTFTSGTDTLNACPGDRTCHLQYLSVSARCAPYDNGSGTPVFYCS